MKQYFTFGPDHRHGGISLGNHYIEVEAKDEHQARLLMIAVFEDKWCAQYNEEEFAKYITKYNPTKYSEIIAKIGEENGS